MKFRQTPPRLVFVIPTWNGSFLAKSKEKDENALIRSPRISVGFVVDPNRLLPDELNALADLIEADLMYL